MRSRWQLDRLLCAGFNVQQAHALIAGGYDVIGCWPVGDVLGVAS